MSGRTRATAQLSFGDAVEVVQSDMATHGETFDARTRYSEREGKKERVRL
jgi:hypothetical protein